MADIDPSPASQRKTAQAANSAAESRIDRAYTIQTSLASGAAT